MKAMMRSLPWIFSMLLAAGTALADTELERAAKAGQLDKVQALVEAGADVNGVDAETIWERTPLMVAVTGGHLEVVRYLLSKGADVTRQGDATGTSPLSEAAQQGHAEVVAALLAAGAAPDFNADVQGRTPLIWALISKEPRAPEVVESLLKAGANSEVAFESLSGNKVPALELAAKAGPEVERAFRQYSGK